MARRPHRARPRGERPVLDEKAARLAAVDLLARKAWGTRELAQRLRRRGASAEVAQAVVADLQSRGYLDDAAFARQWAETRAGSRRVGSVRLRQELAAKGIPKELAAAAIEAAFEESPSSTAPSTPAAGGFPPSAAHPPTASPPSSRNTCFAAATLPRSPAVPSSS